MAEALRRHPLATGDVTLALTDDEGIRDLNRTYRGIDAPTDVLAFPAGPFSGGALGDVAISVETARRQAAARGRSPKWELAVLGLHGTLHLLGWEDEDEVDRAAMLCEANGALEACGLTPDPEWGSIYADLARAEASR
ncbi:MAG: rRNA maturation RNase YbeY [Fimbriimonadaceae bacterium]|nr:rRNA maturation RNase YbeY [Fimbriimonadaceae bacterium]